MFVHCCHCTWCQRETGSAFALNALIESDRIKPLGPAETQLVKVSSASGEGQTIARCPQCLIGVWSNYGEDGDYLRFVRVGTLDHSECVPPSVQIYTSTKLPWVVLDEKSVPVREEYYNWREVWPEESKARWKALEPKIKAEQERVKASGKP